MKTCLVLCIAVLAVSLTQASVTYRQLLQLAKPADDSVKADHEIHLGELDDEVDFQSILKQMGQNLNSEEWSYDGKENIIEEHSDFESTKTNKGNAEIDDSVKASDCACAGKICVCCNTLTFTYEGKQYYIVLCCRITYIRASYFLVELFLQGTRVYYTYVSRITNVYYTVNSAFKVGCYAYYVSSNKICFYLYFLVNGSTYKCENTCLTVSASRFGTNLEKSDV